MDGQQHGLYTQWHDNSQKCFEVNFVNYKKEGLYQEWYENGQKVHEINFINDKEHGTWKSWNEDGTKRPDKYYDHGRLVDNH